MMQHLPSSKWISPCILNNKNEMDYTYQVPRKLFRSTPSPSHNKEETYTGYLIHVGGVITSQSGNNYSLGTLH